MRESKLANIDYDPSVRDLPIELAVRGDLASTSCGRCDTGAGLTLKRCLTDQP